MWVWVVLLARQYQDDWMLSICETEEVAQDAARQWARQLQIDPDKFSVEQRPFRRA